MGAPPLTTLAAALAGVTMLGFDTAPFIYFVERHPAYIDLLRDMFRRVDASAIIGCSSVITITELLTRPMALGNASLVNEYRSLLRNSRNFVLLPIDTVIAEKAAGLRALSSAYTRRAATRRRNTGGLRGLRHERPCASTHHRSPLPHP